MAGLPIWQKALLEAGFTETMDVSLPEGEERFESAVILSQFRDGAARTEPLAPGSAGALPSQPLATGSWLVFADRTGVGDQLARMLRARGEHCTLVFAGDRLARGAGDQFEINPGSRRGDVEPPARGRASSAVPVARHHSSLEPRRAMCPGRFHISGGGRPNARLPQCRSPGSKLDRGCGPGVAATLDRHGWRNRDPRRRNGCPGASTVRGLGRVVRNEFPQLETRLVDLSNQPGEDEIASLFRELWTEEREDEVALRGSDRYVLPTSTDLLLPFPLGGEGRNNPLAPSPSPPRERGERSSSPPASLPRGERGERSSSILVPPRSVALQYAGRPGS